MELSEAAEAKLEAWLGPGTWYKNHATNMCLWFEFVDQYDRDTSSTIDEKRLREIIENKAHDEMNGFLRKAVDARVQLAAGILDFLHRTGRTHSPR